MANEAKPVPTEIAIAVWTGRKEFLAMLRARLARGEKIPDDQIVGLVDLCEEYILAHFRDLQRLHKLSTIVGDMAGLMRAYETHSRKAFEVVRSMKDDLHDSSGKVVYTPVDE